MSVSDKSDAWLVLADCEWRYRFGAAAASRKGNASPPTKETEGDWEEMPWLAGQGIGLIHDIPSATDTVERMMTEAGDILGRLAGAIR